MSSDHKATMAAEVRAALDAGRKMERLPGGSMRLAGATYRPVKRVTVVQPNRRAGDATG